jgi:5-amino-6-(5-phosphoribosylamino)uracil reductase
MNPERRPYVLLSAACSVDGYLDDASPRRLVLSDDADWARVARLRASVDAIMVGAQTIRADDPRLVVRAQGGPKKVTVTASGDLDPNARFFTLGTAEKLVYTADAAKVAALREVATVVGAGAPVDLQWLLDDLFERGVRRLMVEGGGTLHTQLLTAGLVDEIQLAVAPIFVGDAAAPRFVGPGAFPQGRMELVDVAKVGDMAVLRYLLGGMDG